MTGPGITTLNAQGKLRRDEVWYVHRGRLGTRREASGRGTSELLSHLLLPPA